MVEGWSCARQEEKKRTTERVHGEKRLSVTGEDARVGERSSASTFRPRVFYLSNNIFYKSFFSFTNKNYLDLKLNRN